MLNKLLLKITDPRNEKSLSAKFRAKRFSFFKSLLQSGSLPLKILDVGGRETIWTKEFLSEPNQMRDVKITILNLKETKVTHPNLKAVVGDAKNMKQFKDGEFDLVFSNSVIEHVGDYDQQRQMSEEIKRVGKRYFLQTPNYYFPIEPHFMFPFFQFLPLGIKVWLITHFDLCRRKKVADKSQAIKTVSSVKLLKKKELMKLFPGANIFEEKFLGLTKSFIVYYGWKRGGCT